MGAQVQSMMGGGKTEEPDPMDPNLPRIFATGIDKGDLSQPLGVDLDLADSRNLIVKRVGNGLIKENNERNPEYRISPGDRIVEVNGVSGNSELMRQEMANKTHLVLTVERGYGMPPPTGASASGRPPPTQNGGRMDSQGRPASGYPGASQGGQQQPYRPPGSQPYAGPGTARPNDLVPPDFNPHGHQPRPHGSHHHHHHHHHGDDRHTPLPDMGPPSEPGYAIGAYHEGRFLAEAPRTQALLNRERRRDWGYDPFYQWRTDPLTQDDLQDPFGEWRYPKEAYYGQLQDQRYQQPQQQFQGGPPPMPGSQARPSGPPGSVRPGQYPSNPPGQGRQPPPPPPGGYASSAPYTGPSAPSQQQPPPAGQQQQPANPERLLAGPPLRGAGPDAALFLPLDTMEGAAALRKTPPPSPRSRAGAPVPQLTYAGPLRPTVSVMQGGPASV
eukprot:CAMPEP_0178444312 /NCGR_PEP_ID=MMETSP0689_2-20121128/39422_1 /TAXON_ID=160604 /ORGANISM="Amphidinium massartii, Strain CS-259" /LENGTH=442 /DNA_ID=CAMNT_0020068499 /DNA_START=28 /DNA_END=1352 /DNA_ORIENTATION=+